MRRNPTGDAAPATPRKPSRNAVEFRVLPSRPASRSPAPEPAGGAAFLSDSRFEIDRLRRLAEAAVAQVPGEAALHRQIPPEGNSVAILMRHLAGNLRSRWTEFLSTDGEKPDRNREGEFVPRPDLDRKALLAEWEAAFSLAEAEMGALGPGDLEREVTIRGEPFTARQAILRQITHLAYHAGQIVLLARVAAAEGRADWRSLSIPPGSAPGQAPRYRR